MYIENIRFLSEFSSMFLLAIYSGKKDHFAVSVLLYYQKGNKFLRTYFRIINIYLLIILLHHSSSELIAAFKRILRRHSNDTNHRQSQYNVQ